MTFPNKSTTITRSVSRIPESYQHPTPPETGPGLPASNLHQLQAGEGGFEACSGHEQGIAGDGSRGRVAVPERFSHVEDA